MERPPTPILIAAVLAIFIAGYDVVQTLLALLSPEGTGRVFGTFLRDALLAVAAFMLLQRAAWALWVLVALFALSLLRVYAADDWLTFAVNALAVAGLAALLLPASRAWVARAERAAPKIL